MDCNSKKYVHDHVSSYKNRGEKLGYSNRFVRAHRANEDRRLARQDELTKRRRILSSLSNLSVEESPSQKKTTIKPKEKAKGKSSTSKENEPLFQSSDERKAMLLKWKEQRELKRKADANRIRQKALFAVRHVKNDNKAQLALFPTKATKISFSIKSTTASVLSAKRMTRSSARLASKQTVVKPQTKTKTASNRKEASTAKKSVDSKKSVKVKEVPKRLTRQSVKDKTTAIKEKEDIDNEKNQLEEDAVEDAVEEAVEEATEEESEAVEIQNKATPLAENKQHTLPQKFHFSPPSGLNSFEYYSNNFKFKPLSPLSTESFFKGITPAIPTGTEEPSSSGVILSNKEDIEIQNKENDGEGSKEVESKDKPLSRKYFRDLILTETEKLNSICEKWEKVTEAENDIPEQAKGNIRTAVGQAQLLISQRFKQFSGLIELSLDETAEKKATLSDLQGFWDMIYFQVEDVHTKMENLEKQKEKNWIEETKKAKTTNKKAKKNTTAKIVGSKAPKPPTKSRIKEMKAAMRAKMDKKKRQLQGEDGENRSFITVLTPIKKIKTPAGCIVLTPVRRSLRNTPIRRLSGTPRTTPMVISTPKRFGNKSPGLRLTPEALTVSPSASGSDKTAMTDMENGQKSHDVEEMKVEGDSCVYEVQTSNLSAKQSDCTTENTEGDKKSKTRNAFYLSASRRSCLRSSTKKGRKSSSVFFQSPISSTKSTAGGTPGPLVFTPGAQGNARSTGVTFTPVAVAFDSPMVEGSTCSLDAGHTPAIVRPRKGSLRKRNSNGTPVRRSSRKHPQATPEGQDKSSDSASEASTVEGHDGTPLGCLDNELTGRSGSKRRSLRRSCTKRTENEKDCFLPDKYILPSTSSEEDCDVLPSATSPILAVNVSPANDQALVTITPVKGLSNQLNLSGLTPATMLQALNLDDSLDPSVESTRRDSVFFAPTTGPLLDNGRPAKQNLICFSPVGE